MKVHKVAKRKLADGINGDQWLVVGYFSFGRP